MKLKTTWIILIITGLITISCRESDEVTPLNESENFNLLGSKIVTDTIRYNSTENTDSNDPPKDPPIKGTHWKN